MTLRARFAAMLGASIFAAMVLVAIASAIGTDVALRNALDARLTTAARGIGSLVDIDRRTQRVELTDEDLRQAHSLLAPGMTASVLDRNAHEIAHLGNEREPARGALVQRYPLRLKDDRVGEVLAWSSGDEVSASVRSALLVAIVAALAFGAVALLLSWNLAGRALAPLHVMALLAEDIEAHDLGRRLRSTSADETGRLARAFNRMLDRLQAAFERQRTFTADASHELRAPLAVIRAEADVALERERDAAEYRLALESIGAEVARADAVIAALLATARADAAPLHVQEWDLLDIAAEVASRLEPLARAHGVTLRVHGDGVRVSLDRALFESGLQAVVHNAVRFATREIALRVGTIERDAFLEVADDGIGFSSAALLYGTQRFWRESQTRTHPGSGLGLAVAEACVRRHGGTLRLSNAPSGGAVVDFIVPFIAASSGGAMLQQ